MHNAEYRMLNRKRYNLSFSRIRISDKPVLVREEQKGNEKFERLKFWAK